MFMRQRLASIRPSTTKFTHFISVVALLALSGEVFISPTSAHAAPAPTKMSQIVAKPAPLLAAAQPVQAVLPTAYPVSPTKSWNAVPIKGGTAKQRALIKSLLKKHGARTNIQSVTINKGNRRLGETSFWTPDPSSKAWITLRAGMAPTKMKAVFLHELAHAKKLWTYRGDYDALARATTKKFSGTGYRSAETAADCMARKLGAAKAHLYYKKTCSKAELTHAATLLKGKQL